MDKVDSVLFERVYADAVDARKCSLVLYAAFWRRAAVGILPVLRPTACWTSSPGDLLQGVVPSGITCISIRGLWGKKYGSQAAVKLLSGQTLS